MRSEAVVVAFFLCVTPGLASRRAAGALVMAVRIITPSIEVMSRSRREQFWLAPGAELTFIHYTCCKMVTVTAGAVTVTRTDVVTDARLRFGQMRRARACIS